MFNVINGSTAAAPPAGSRILAVDNASANGCISDDDAVTWSAVTLPAFANGTLTNRCICWGNGTYIVLRNGADAIYSSDAQSWNSGTISNHDWSGVTWNAVLALFIAFSFTNTFGLMHWATSPTGAIWTDQTPFTTELDIVGAATLSGVTAAVAGVSYNTSFNSAWSYTSNGTSGAYYTPAAYEPLGDVCRLNSQLVACGSLKSNGVGAPALRGKNAWTSTNGSAWTKHSGVLSANLFWIAMSASLTQVIALDFGSYGGSVSTAGTVSTNGTVWAAFTLPASRVWYDSCFNGNVFCAVSGGTSRTAGYAADASGTWGSSTMTNNGSDYRLVTSAYAST